MSSRPREVRPLGVGINLLPHAVRVLTALGLQEELARVAVATSELAYHNKFGQGIWREPRGSFAGYHWPQFSIHRGTFQMILFDTALWELGEDKIHTGHHLIDCEQVGDKVRLTFQDKSTENSFPVLETDLLIGSDGIHSVVRNKFFPNEDLPKFSGIILHRGTTIANPFLSGSSMIMAGHAAQKFVAYPISPVHERTGKQRINWIADLKVGDDGNIPVRDWNRRADKQKLLDAFSNWKFRWLDIPGLIQGAESIFEFPMSDRDPLPRWTFGRITLLGDAAHPMYPIGSNGASQAILDAESLTRSLQDINDPEAALKAYESVRLPATSAIVLQNRQMGPEQVMQLAEERAPEGFKDIEKVIPRQELEAIAARYKQIAGFDREKLNSQNIGH
jgi:2-polyprenyl-6-methoxyphenol hydroxylase-like FAD-dependent oxidoreductase